MSFSGLQNFSEGKRRVVQMTLGLGMRRGIVWGIGLAAMAACGGGGEPLPDAATLEIVAASNGQTALAGATLPQALAVIARATSGVAVPRARVRWTVTMGTGATLSDSVTMADGLGQAEVGLRLGPAAGEYRVQAALVAVPAQTVVLTATAAAGPALTGVTPATFSAGDTLQLDGAALAATAEVEIGGAPVRVLSGTAARLTVVAPICIAPGAVTVRALVQGAWSNAVQGTYTSSTAPLALAVGEYASLDPAQLAGCAAFADAGPSGAEYLIAPQSTIGTPGATASYQIRGDSVVVSLSAAEPHLTTLPFAMRFHDMLRAQERAASLLPHPPAQAALLAPSAQVTVKVGDQRTFQTCINLPCVATSDFVTATAHAQYVGLHAALFTDDAAPAGFTAADYDSVGAMFDQDLYDVDTHAFGAESDIDANGVVVVLFTPSVNRLTPKDECATSVITGYFFGIDIDPLFQADRRSNKGELFYALAPDPSGTVTCTLSKASVLRLVPVTFIHEFQHMISYNQHVLVRGEASEVLWLNEGMSHVAEELGALHYEALGRDDLFSQFAIGDVYNTYLYLQDPGAVSLLPDAGTGTLEERGASWAFLRWLRDQYGDDITRRLDETDRTGASNVAAAVGEPFGKLVSQWFLANYVSDLPGFSAPPRLMYQTWHFRTTFQSLHDQLPSRFPLAFPLVPLQFNGGTFAFSGTLRAGSGDYFRVVQTAGQKGFTLLVTGPGGAALPATIDARLNVIRIQ
jgi:hypothetical protein